MSGISSGHRLARLILSAGIVAFAPGPSLCGVGLILANPCLRETDWLVGDFWARVAERLGRRSNSAYRTASPHRRRARDGRMSHFQLLLRFEEARVVLTPAEVRRSDPLAVCGVPK